LSAGADRFGLALNGYDARTIARVEWTTVLVIVLTYAAFGLLTAFHAALPLWLFVPAGAFIAALHSSLQHEALHGHPTRRAWLNWLLVFPCLWLFVPYRLYRSAHLAHHRDPLLTAPLDDPESCYVTAERWQRVGLIGRGFLWAHNTFLGRIVLGPIRGLVCVYGGLARQILRGRVEDPLGWILHIPAVAIPLLWAVWFCGLPLWLYLLTFLYGGMALSQIRTFLEHQARPNVGERTVVIESGPLFSLLFLNNNLHSVHHALPWLPWYRIPAVYRDNRAAVLRHNGGYRYAGYTEVALRYFLRAKERPVHPTFQEAMAVAPRPTPAPGAAHLPQGALADRA